MLDKFDKLDEIFYHQQELQQNMKQVYDQEYITIMTLAAIDELLEALHETKWKPWKKNQSFNNDRFRTELVDAWHFLMNLTLAAGFTPAELHEAYLHKNKINHERHEGEY